jgi:hypothetical protein
MRKASAEPWSFAAPCAFDASALPPSPIAAAIDVAIVFAPRLKGSASRTLDVAIRARVDEIYASLDPVALLRDIRAMQERLATLTDAAPASGRTAPPPIDQFLASLRAAWKEGAGRPTDRPIVKAKRERRRPDPLVKGTPQLRQWFEAEPWRTSSELLSRLQAEYPETYPSNVLRTLQRRLKSWRGEQANALLFGSMKCAQGADAVVVGPPGSERCSAEEAGRCATPTSSTTGLLSPAGLGTK